MSVSTQHRDTTPSAAVVTEDRPLRISTSRRHGRVLAAVVGGLAVATAGLVLLVASPQSTPASTPADLSAYAAGGSVYAEQVPLVATPWTSSYAEGSSVYAQQVPIAAAPWTASYAVGTSTYREQVPVAAIGSWTVAFGPGSATYDEQVPDPAGH
jgi:hypothetical protein